MIKTLPVKKEFNATIAAVVPEPEIGITLSCPDFFFIQFNVLTF